MKTCPHCGYDLEEMRPFTVGDLMVENGGADVYWKGQKVRLRASERLIILALARAEGAIMRQGVLAEVAGYEGNNPTNIVAVLIHRIRRKFQEIDPSFHSIQTFPRDGLRWVA